MPVPGPFCPFQVKLPFGRCPASLSICSDLRQLPFGRCPAPSSRHRHLFGSCPAPLSIYLWCLASLSIRCDLRQRRCILKPRVAAIRGAAWDSINRIIQTPMGNAVKHFEALFCCAKSLSARVTHRGAHLPGVPLMGKQCFPCQKCFTALPDGVYAVNGIRFPGCAAKLRPWAMESNAVGVKNRQVPLYGPRLGLCSRRSTSLNEETSALLLRIACNQSIS